MAEAKKTTKAKAKPKAEKPKAKAKEEKNPNAIDATLVINNEEHTQSLSLKKELVLNGKATRVMQGAHTLNVQAQTDDMIVLHCVRDDLDKAEEDFKALGWK